MPKEIKFEWRKWHTIAVTSIIFFALSYLMAVTVPDCARCKVGEDSAMQFFHVTFMFLFGVGSVITCILALVNWWDE